MRTNVGFLTPYAWNYILISAPSENVTTGLAGFSATDVPTINVIAALLVTGSEDVVPGMSALDQSDFSETATLDVIAALLVTGSEDATTGLSSFIATDTATSSL